MEGEDQFDTPPFKLKLSFNHRNRMVRVGEDYFVITTKIRKKMTKNFREEEIFVSPEMEARVEQAVIWGWTMLEL